MFAKSVEKVNERMVSHSARAKDWGDSDIEAYGNFYDFLAVFPLNTSLRRNVTHIWDVGILLHGTGLSDTPPFEACEVNRGMFLRLLMRRSLTRRNLTLNLKMGKKSVASFYPAMKGGRIRSLC